MYTVLLTNIAPSDNYNFQRVRKCTITNIYQNRLEIIRRKKKEKTSEWYNFSGKVKSKQKKHNKNFTMTQINNNQKQSIDKGQELWSISLNSHNLNAIIIILSILNTVFAVFAVFAGLSRRYKTASIAQLQ